VHHGNANPNRKIENYLDLMEMLDNRFTLDLYLMPRDPSYLARIKRKAETLERVTVHDPIPMQELVSVCNRYDIGIFFQEPLNFNLKHSLPNKVFEFVQARLAIAVTPLPEIKKLVNKNGIGIVSDDFGLESMAKRLNKLDKQEIENYKRNSDIAAKVLNSEKNLKQLDGIIIGILNK
jgi:hypothetical protein